MLGVQRALAKDIEGSLCTNVAPALFSTSPGDAPKGEAAVERAVEAKFDALRDQLLLEALVDQFGAAEWARMSEEQRQRHLAALRLKERQLRAEGRWEELGQLLGEAARNAEQLSALLGDEKAEQERRLRERLARRQQRLQEGVEESEAERLMAEEEARDEKELAESRKNVLRSLDLRCEKVRLPVLLMKGL